MTSRLDELKKKNLLCVIFIIVHTCVHEIFVSSNYVNVYTILLTIIIQLSFQEKSLVMICREKNVKLTNWRHPYFSHFRWMVWGAGKFVVKTARVYRVNRITQFTQFTVSDSVSVTL